jgi:hypothetical protein
MACRQIRIVSCAGVRDAFIAELVRLSPPLLQDLVRLYNKTDMRVFGKVSGVGRKPRGTTHLFRGVKTCWKAWQIA